MAIKEVFIEQVGAVTISRNRQALRFKIAIRPDGRIRVTIPWLASFRTGEKFLIEHLPWIDETRRKLALNPTEPKHIHPGHLFTTRNYEYHICPAEVKNLRIKYAHATKQVYFEYPMNLPIEDNEERKKTNTGNWRSERGKSCVMPEGHDFKKIEGYLRKGQVALLHSHVVHGSEPNRDTTRMRRNFLCG